MNNVGYNRKNIKIELALDVSFSYSSVSIFKKYEKITFYQSNSQQIGALFKNAFIVLNLT